MSTIDRRGEVVAWLGLGWSLVGAVVLAILAIWTMSASVAVWAAGFQLLGVAGIWLLTLLQLHQRRLLAEERLEVAELVNALPLDLLLPYHLAPFCGFAVAMAKQSRPSPVGQSMGEVELHVIVGQQNAELCRQTLIELRNLMQCGQML